MSFSRPSIVPFDAFSIGICIRKLKTQKKELKIETEIPRAPISSGPNLPTKAVSTMPATGSNKEPMINGREAIKMPDLLKIF
jgi:hypothetical protein